MKGNIFLLGAVCAALAGPATAADRTITTGVSEPVKTSNPDGTGSPGNITIGSAGSVIISTPGAAVTLDGDSTISIERDANGVGGVIRNSAGSGGIGIQILGGFAGSLTSAGTIDLTGTTGPNYGIVVGSPTALGDSVFTGALTINGGITVAGKDSTGFRVSTPILGNITIGGGIGANGENSSGVIISSAVTGALVQSGFAGAQGTLSYSVTAVDPQGGWGLAVGANITGGILLGGPSIGTPSTAASTVQTVGSKPGLYISPLVPGRGEGITIGNVTSDEITGRSLITRGTVSGDGNDPGVSSTAFRIEGASADLTGPGVSRLVLLPGGISNTGTVRAAANSSNATATSVAAASANATAMAIGTGANIGAVDDGISDLSNTGTISATVGLTQGFTVGSKGGTATALLIENGGILNHLDNTGSITASAFTSDSKAIDLRAYAIRDVSGSLQRITNSGAIEATGTATDSGTTLIAADLSIGTNVSFDNTGTITGSLIFGRSGQNTYTQNTSLTTRASSTTGRLTSAGTNNLDVIINGGTLKTDVVESRNFTVASGATLEIALNKTTSQTDPLIKVSGAASFADDSKLALTPTSFIPKNGTYVLARAGTLTYGTVEETPLPFLISGAGSGVRRGGASGQDLLLTIQRKTALELGMDGNAAAIYEAASSAAALDDTFGASLLLISNAQEARDSVTSLLPNIGGGARALALAATDQATGPIGTRQRALIAQPKQGLGFWAQEFYSNINQQTTAQSASFFGSGLGISMGAEWGDNEAVAPAGAAAGDGTTNRYGLGYTYFAGQVTESRPRATKSDVALHMASLYAAWRWNDFFVAEQANAGVALFTGNRTAVTPGFTRDLEGIARLDAQGTQRIARGDWTSYMTSGGITAGYVMNLGPVQIIPQISVDALYMHQLGYTENGGGDGVNLEVGTQDVRSFRLFAGVSAQSPFVFEGGRMLPQVLAGWSHEFVKNPITIDASFEALPGSNFALVGPQVDPSKLIGGAGLSYVFDNWSAGVNYDASHSSGSLAQSATVSLTSKF